MMTVVDTDTTVPRLQRCKENEKWMKLVTPWVTIAIIACSYTVVVSNNSREDIILNRSSDSDAYHPHHIKNINMNSNIIIDSNDSTFMNHRRRMKDEFFDDDEVSDSHAIPTSATLPNTKSATGPVVSASSSFSSTASTSTPFTIMDSPPIHHTHHKPVFQEDHKPLFPLNKSDWYGVFFTIVGLIVAAGGGIGGGGILVPIYILVMGFSPKHAIPLSNVTVFGGAIANVLLNMPKRHPIADRPLVDWDLILVMEPLTIAGALLGAFLNKLLPELLLTILLVLLLSSTAYDTLKRAIKMYKKETLALKKQGRRVDGNKESELTHVATEELVHGMEEATKKLLDDVDVQETGEVTKSTDNGTTSTDDKHIDPTIDESTKLSPQEREKAKLQAELDEILEQERVTPKINLQILIIMFVVVLTINMLKGGGAFHSPLGIVCGSTGFWLANVLMIGWILMVSIFVRQYLLKKYEAKKRTNYQYVEGDIQWDERASIVYPGICMFAGFFAGMFGVGGGIVKGPLMLAMGVHPAVSSASSACMILFTSFTATTSYVVFGLLVPDYAVVCLLIGFLATFGGQICLTYLMKKFQRNSLIAFSIGAVVLLSAFLMSIQSLLSMAAGETHQSGGVCGKGN